MSKAITDHYRGFWGMLPQQHFGNMSALRRILAHFGGSSANLYGAWLPKPSHYRALSFHCWHQQTLVARIDTPTSGYINARDNAKLKCFTLYRRYYRLRVYNIYGYIYIYIYKFVISRQNGGKLYTSRAVGHA